MSTRSNTIISDKNTNEKEILYRHFDGYVSGAGVDLMSYVRKMLIDFKKKHVTADVVHVKDWILKNGDSYEDTNAINGDVEYIYEVIVDNGDIQVKAFTTKMFASSRNEAVKDEDVTAELIDEWKIYCEENGIDDDSAKSSDACVSLSLREKVGGIVATLWQTRFRDMIVDAVIDAATILNDDIKNQ